MKACVTMRNYRDMTDEEFAALPEEERKLAVFTAGMCADYLSRKWLDGQLKSPQEWDKTLRNVLGKPKKQSRQQSAVKFQEIVLAAAFVMVLVVIS